MNYQSPSLSDFKRARDFLHTVAIFNGLLAANKILDVQITESASALSQDLFTIIDMLKDGGVSLSLAAPPAALDARSLGRLRALPLRMLLLSTRSLDELGYFLEIQQQTKGRTTAGVAFTVTRDNLGDVPDVLAFCVRHGTASLVLPMQRLAAGEACFSLSRDERRELTSRLRQNDRPARLKIVIHDPFPWRAFFPSTAFPAGGCQAANTMLYISPSADVYPCPSFPVKLGNLMQESLSGIIQSDGKKELRKLLATAPRDCGACEERERCRGGAGEGPLA